jgi:hypothetical protein
LDQASTLPISNIGIPAFLDLFPADIAGQLRFFSRPSQHSLQISAVHPGRLATVGLLHRRKCTAERGFGAPLQDHHVIQSITRFFPDLNQRMLT